jgi:excisionase family DNA binding protein
VQSVSIAEAARRLGCSTKTVRRRILAGELAAHKASGPGGYQYRVTDPSVLVIAAGEARVPSPLATRTKRDDGGWPAVVKDLLDRLSVAEQRALRAEWELELLRTETTVPRPEPRPSLAIGLPKRRWWPWSQPR